MMRLNRPKSVLGLVLIGFSLVALPLLLASVRAGLAVDALADSAGRLVLQGVGVTRINERLAEQLTDMERYARQFYVVGDPALWGLYLENKASFAETLRILQALDTERRLTAHIAELSTHASALAETIPERTDPPPADAPPVLLAHFDALRSGAASIARTSNRFLDTELEALDAAATRSRRELWWQVTALLPITVVLAATFTVMIAQPIRGLQHAITRLGEQGYDDPIAISGPPELRTLGARLDWLRERLREADETKNTFLRHMSHELKTPLASLREGSELLADGTVGRLSETQQEVADILQENCLKLQALIENLLDFSAWQHDASRLNLSSIELRPLVEACIAQHCLEITRKQLQIDIEAAAVELRADRVKLRTAIDNLIANAIKYSPRGGRVLVEISGDDTSGCLDVIDQGPGIPAADRDLVFEPFFRGAPQTNTAIRGTGIGLSVVRECARAHDGSIELVDDRTIGTHLRLTLPIGEMPGAAHV